MAENNEFMTPAELEGLIDKKTQERFDSMLDPAVEAKVKSLITESGDEWIGKQVEEHLQDALDKIKIPKSEAEKAQEEADKPAWKSDGEFLSAIYNVRRYGKLDDRLIYLNAKGELSRPDVNAEGFKIPAGVPIGKTLVEGTDSSGGFLVPTEFNNQLRMLSLEDAIVEKNGAVVLQMGSDRLEFPRVVDTTHASSVYGGIVGGWTAEGDATANGDPAFGNGTLEAREYSGYTVVTNRLLQDSAIALETLLRTMFGNAWGYYKDDAFIEGTGNGMPIGVTQAACLVSVTRQDTNNVFFRDIANIWGRVLPASRKRGVWLINHEVLPELISMVAENAAPAATAGNVIWVNPNQGAAQGVPGTIMGRPYFETEKVPAMGDASDIGFYDFGHYLIGERQPLTIDVSEHVEFKNNKSCWRFIFRVDGQPWLASALTPKNGTSTLSPFVSLSSSS